LTRLTVKSVKFGLKVGDIVPAWDEHSPGNVGNYFEGVLQNQGLDLKGTGIDIPSLNMEVKTRKNDAQAALTVCSMSIHDIINTDYENSRVCQSVENLLILRYCNTLNVVTSVDVHNWNKYPLVKEIVSSSYEKARAIFKTGNYTNYVRGGKKYLGYFEEKNKDNPNNDLYAFRFGAGSLIKMETTSRMPALRMFEFK
jgi:hypothetical protein